MSQFKWTYAPFTLKLRRAFTIARGTRREATNVLVRIERDDIVGYGEAAPNKRYDETPQKVMGFLDQLDQEILDDIPNPEVLSNRLAKQNPAIRSARCAVETAYLDWYGKKENRSVFRLMGGRTSLGSISSYTLGMAEPQTITDKLEEAESYPLLKVKLGGSRDRETIKLIRQHSKKPIFVDVNEGWKNLDVAKSQIDFLADKNVILLEQPMPADHNWEELCELKSYSPIPICADEGFVGDESITKIKKAYDCINIKIMKTGSLIKSLELIRQAKREQLKVLIGCMIESSIADSASAMLTLWSDFADIDGRLLIEEDPFEGVTLTDDYHLKLKEIPGIGIRRSDKWENFLD